MEPDFSRPRDPWVPGVGAAFLATLEARCFLVGAGFFRAAFLLAAGADFLAGEAASGALFRFFLGGAGFPAVGAAILFLLGGCGPEAGAFPGAEEGLRGMLSFRSGIRRRTIRSASSQWASSLPSGNPSRSHR